jgi:hypothetical protein
LWAGQNLQIYTTFHISNNPVEKELQAARCALLGEQVDLRIPKVQKAKIAGQPFPGGLRWH